MRKRRHFGWWQFWEPFRVQAQVFVGFAAHLLLLVALMVGTAIERHVVGMLELDAATEAIFAGACAVALLGALVRSFRG